MLLSKLKEEIDNHLKQFPDGEIVLDVTEGGIVAPFRTMVFVNEDETEAEYRIMCEQAFDIFKEDFEEVEEGEE